jgi:hypothetical protein
MTQYLISFGAHAMDYIPDEEGPAVGKDALAVVREAKDAGVYVSSTCPHANRRASWPPTGRSPTARARRPRRSSAGSQSSTCPQGNRPLSGLPRSLSPVAVLKRSACFSPALAFDRRRAAAGSCPTAPRRVRSPDYLKELQQQGVQQ